MVIGAILQCTAFGLAQLIVGRVITGVGNGLNTSTVPTWQSECSKSHRRGQLVLIEGALVVGGVCISYCESLFPSGLQSIILRDTLLLFHCIYLYANMNQGWTSASLFASLPPYLGASRSPFNCYSLLLFSRSF